MAFCDEVRCPKFIGVSRIGDKVSHILNLTAFHKGRRWEIENREREQQRLLQEKKNEEDFINLKSKFFGLIITDEEISVKVLESIDEYYNGSALLFTRLMMRSWYSVSWLCLPWHCTTLQE